MPLAFHGMQGSGAATLRVALPVLLTSPDAHKLLRLLDPARHAVSPGEGELTKGINRSVQHWILRPMHCLQLVDQGGCRPRSDKIDIMTNKNVNCAGVHDIGSTYRETADP